MDDHCVPVDDSGANHLVPGTPVAPVALPAASGDVIALAELAGLSVVYCYTWTGRPDLSDPPGWDDIPGAHGSTPQTQGYVKFHSEFIAKGVLYATLGEFGYTEGTFDARADDGLTLKGCMITNAVRCVPPANKPTGAEINTCRDYLSARIASLPELRAILVLGRIAHDSTLRMFGAKLKDHPFAHNAAHDLGLARDLAARHDLAVDHANTLTMFDSYHCSRYNTNTGRLTTDMFRSVFKSIAEHLENVSS